MEKNLKRLSSICDCQTFLGHTPNWPSCSLPSQNAIVPPPQSLRWPALTLLWTQPGLSTVLVHTCMSAVPHCVRARYGAMVKKTGLWGSNVLRPVTDCLV